MNTNNDILSHSNETHFYQDGVVLTEWNVTLKVDDCGFFIYWKGKDTEGDVLELSQVNDIRPGKYPNVRNIT